MGALTATLTMAAIQGGLAVAQTVGQYSEQRRAAKIAEQQGNFEAQLLGTNASLAEAQAEDALSRGREGGSRTRRGMNQLTGSQRAAMAAQGIDVDVGSAVDVVESDRMLGELDILTIKHNAQREAWGFKTQAASYRSQADWARNAGRNEAKALRNRSISTLLSGAGDLFNIYQSYGKTSGPRASSSGEYGTSPYAGNRYGMLG